MTIEHRALDGIYYAVRGAGSKTVVLLRGLGRWSDHWMGFEDVLAKEGCRVITVDNRGFGKSGAVTLAGSLSIDQLAEDVAMIIAKEAPGGAHIVGVSLGGMIGLSLAALKPQFVLSLMIVNSSVSSAKMPRLTKKGLLALASVVARSKKGYETLAEALLAPSSSPEKKMKLAKSWQLTDAAQKPKLSHVWAQLMAARKFSGLPEMAAARCPVTIVKCAGDLFVDPKNSEFIQKNIRNAELVIHPTAGHELAFDDPEWFKKAIMKQLEACP